MAERLVDATNVVVVNSCTVTAAADRDTRKAVHRARREHGSAAVVLMGCYADSHPGDSLGADLVLPNAWKRSAGVGSQPLPLTQVEPPGVRRSRFVLKVQDGCDNRCTFCIVWQTRGRSLSRVLPYLEARARAAAAAGYREIVLAGIDLGSYRGGIAPLVKRLLAAAAPARIRLSSIDPSHVDRELIELLADPRLCPRLKSAYEERFHGKRLAVIWDRQFGGLIRGVSENYIQVAAPAAGRRAGELEEVVWQPASSAP